MRIDRRGVEDLAGAIDDGDFDAGSQARIEAHGGARARGRGQQQVVQIERKHANRFFFGHARAVPRTARLQSATKV